MIANIADELWHKRLCHMSQKGMQMLAKKDLLLEMKKDHQGKCVNCLVGKQNRATFRSRPLMRKKMSLELVHMDV